MPRRQFDAKWISIVADSFSALALVIAAFFWLIGGPERHSVAVNSAWQAINSAHDPPGGNGGRIEALERLSREGISLRGVSVPNAYLEGIDLSGSDLAGSHFGGTRLAGARFHRAALQYAHFEHAHLQEARFNGAKARYASFANAFLNKADFTFSPGAQCPPGPPEPASAVPSASPQPAVAVASSRAPVPTVYANAGPDDYDRRWRAVPSFFSAAGEPLEVGIAQDGTNLYNASFFEASLHLAKFCGAYLNQARFDGADAIGATFNGAVARYTSFRGAVLEAVDFRNADLTHANFAGACLIATNFAGAKLGGASFDGARFGVDPNEHKTNFAGADVDAGFVPIKSVIDDLDVTKLHAGFPVVVYDESIIGGRHSLVARLLRPANQRPPSCPVSTGAVPTPAADFGEH